MRIRLDLRAVVLVAGAALAGAGGTAAAGAALGMPGGDVAHILTLLLPSAVVALGVAALAPPLLARRPIRHRAVAVALSGVAMALASLSVGIGFMFVSDHDASVATVMLIYAAAVGVALALALSRASAAAIYRLSEGARELGRGNLAARVGSLGADEELERLARSMDDMAERLQTAIAREREIEVRRRDLMTAVSHDLRTPLASLRAMVEAIDEGVVSDRRTLRRYVTEMGRSVSSLSQLVDDLFELAKVEAGAIERETERARVGDLVRTAVSEVLVRADEKGLFLESSLDGAEDAFCSPRLLHVLQNLLQNAVRHTPVDGTVRIHASWDHAGVEFTVEDTGEGIPPEALSQVFEPFWRGDPARSLDGSGLGLALAKRIVEALGGRIEVRSQVSEGARFDVWVPSSQSRIDVVS